MVVGLDRHRRRRRPRRVPGRLEDTDVILRAAVGPTRRGSSASGAATKRRSAWGDSCPATATAAKVAIYDELEVTALAAHDQQRAAEFVANTLGPLAEDNPAAARLRETLRVYLDEAEHAPRAAARLHTHRNTVLQRVARATELLGYWPGEQRLTVVLALELRRRLGPTAH